MLMKRMLAASLISLGLVACGSHEPLDASMLSNLPTATLKFAATSGLNADLKVLGSVYAGSLGGSAPCGQTFDGCFGLAGGLSAAFGQTLCPGDWTLGTGQLYGSSGGACTGDVIADCTMGTGTAPLAPGTNTVMVTCTTTGHLADVSFDVSFAQ